MECHQAVFWIRPCSGWTADKAMERSYHGDSRQFSAKPRGRCLHPQREKHIDTLKTLETYLPAQNYSRKSVLSTRENLAMALNDPQPTPLQEHAFSIASDHA